MIIPFILKYPFQILAAVLLATNILTVSLWHGASVKLSDEKVAHALDVEVFKTAQKIANKQAEDIEKKLIKEAKANAEQADINYHNLLGKYNASLVRFKANQSATSKAGDHQLPAPEGSDGPSPDTFISITMNDAQICAVNTARLQSIHDWAVTLPKQE